jgi:hypothetical protein
MDTSEIIDKEVKIGVVEPALQALEAAAVRMMDTFPSKSVSEHPA